MFAAIELTYDKRVRLSPKRVYNMAAYITDAIGEDCPIPVEYFQYTDLAGKVLADCGGRLELLRYVNPDSFLNQGNICLIARWDSKEVFKVVKKGGKISIVYFKFGVWCYEVLELYQDVLSKERRALLGRKRGV